MLLKKNLLKTSMGSNFKSLDGRGMIVLFCTSPYHTLPMYTVWLQYTEWFKRYVQDKLSIYKSSKGSNLNSSAGRIMFLKSCTCAYHTLPLYEVWLMLKLNFYLKNHQREMT